MNFLFFKISIICAFCALGLRLPAQGCPFSFHLDSQADVQTFADTFACDEVLGYLLIGAFGTTSVGDITDLSPLKKLKKIHGDLHIRHNLRLKSTAGLDSLAFVGGNIFLQNNDSLLQISGLGKLEHVGGQIFFQDNPELLILDTFHLLDTLQDILWVRNCPKLQSLCCFPRLKLAKETISVINTGITNMKGLDSLHQARSLSIHDNPHLISLEGLSNLRRLSDDLYLQKNAALLSLQGLVNLDSVRRRIEIELNPSLKSLEALGNHINSVHYCIIKNNDALENLSGLDSLITIRNRLNISDNLALKNLDGLKNLTTVGHPGIMFPSSEEHFLISFNDSLQSIAGLSNLKNVMGHFIIRSNPSLQSLHGLDNITVIAGNICIQNNEALVSLEGFPLALDTIQRDLEIWQNDGLLNVEGLNNLVHVKGELIISDNQKVQSFQALSNLTSVSQLATFGGFQATSLTGLQNLNEVGAICIGGTNLVDVSALQNLEKINWYFCFSGNISLPSLEGFENITSPIDPTIDTLPWYVAIYSNSVVSNHSMNTLNILPNLNRIKGKRLDIWDNPNLKTFQGFDHLDTLDVDEVRVHDDTSLTDCEALCRILGAVGIDSVIIFNNPLPCASEAAILAWCDSLENPPSATPLKPEPFVKVSPNPVGSTCQIEVNEVSLPLTFLVYDLKGQLRMAGKMDSQRLQLDFSSFLSGIYLLELRQDSRTIVRKKISVAR